MKIDDLKNRVDELIKMAGIVLTTRRGNDFGEFVSSESFNEFRSASLSFLRNTFGVEHPFYKEFEENSKSARPSIIEVGRGILKAAKQEIDGGWIFTVKVERPLKKTSLRRSKLTTLCRSKLTTS